MSKMSELATQVTELKRCGEMLIGIADTFKDLFSKAEEKTDAEVEKDKSAEKKTLTFEEVRGVLAAKSREGHTAEIKAILTEFGVEKLSDVDPSKYEELLQKVEVM